VVWDPSVYGAWCGVGPVSAPHASPGHPLPTAAGHPLQGWALGAHPAHPVGQALPQAPTQPKHRLRSQAVIFGNAGGTGGAQPDPQHPDLFGAGCITRRLPPCWRCSRSPGASTATSRRRDAA